VLAIITGMLFDLTDHTLTLLVFVEKKKKKFGQNVMLH
jgi:hypothetical protein